MRLVYRNPKELASKVRDAVDLYQDNLISYDKLEQIIVGMIEKNEDRVYKYGFMPAKLFSDIGDERKNIIDEIAKNAGIINNE